MPTPLLKLALHMSILATLAAKTLAAQAPAAPTPAPLWPGPAPFAQGSAEIDVPTLTAYLPAENPTHTAVIIAPGGSYTHLSMQKEGSDIAHWLNERGVAGFVLTYRLGPKYHHPAELADAQRAIRSVRAQAAALGVAPDHVGIWGFSAGGHLAASAGTLFDLGPSATSFPAAFPVPDEIDKQSARPDFLILSYPVISMVLRYAHKDSRTNLLGDNPDPALVDLLSAEKHVTASTPPTFIVSTTDDPVVPVMNSVLFYAALVSAKVPAEMHLFAHGPHGIGLARGLPDLKGWPDLLGTWLRARSLMAPAAP